MLLKVSDSYQLIMDVPKISKYNYDFGSGKYIGEIQDQICKYEVNISNWMVIVNNE